MAKSVPNRLGMYADVREILDAALRSNGGTYTLPSNGAAVHWRQRAYKFRKLYASLLGEKRESPYDAITLPRIKDGSSQVVIKLIQSQGKFIPNQEPDTGLDLGDDVEAFAADLAKRLEGSTNGTE